MSERTVSPTELDPAALQIHGDLEAIKGLKEFADGLGDTTIRLTVPNGHGIDYTFRLVFDEHQATMTVTSGDTPESPDIFRLTYLNITGGEEPIPWHVDHTDSTGEDRFKGSAGVFMAGHTETVRCELEQRAAAAQPTKPSGDTNYG